MVYILIYSRQGCRKPCHLKVPGKYILEEGPAIYFRFLTPPHPQGPFYTLAVPMDGFVWVVGGIEPWFSAYGELNPPTKSLIR